MSVLHDSVTAEGWLCQNTLPNYCILEQVKGSEWPKPVKQARLCQARLLTKSSAWKPDLDSDESAVTSHFD
jgi:hypothetical protein